MNQSRAIKTVRSLSTRSKQFVMLLSRRLVDVREGGRITVTPAMSARSFRFDLVGVLPREKTGDDRRQHSDAQLKPDVPDNGAEQSEAIEP